MTEETVDLKFLAKLVQRTNEEVRAMRSELADVRTLTLQTYEFSRRLERRHAELRDDLEVMLKMELTGALTHLQSTIENKMEELSDRMTVVESRPT